MARRPLQFDVPGRVVGGRYVLGEALGRGGMATVYRVCDVRSGRHLALKRVRAQDGDRARIRSALLEREYHTLAQLRHPSIIEVYDYGVDEDGPYYTMELLDGADIESTGRLQWKQACALLRDVASSLAILHSRGLIHRDVSSRNVRRTADGRAKLIDFGAMTPMGVAKEVVGTPPFTAPEVLQLQALDSRADLFSLGALGYYALTGRHAYPVRRLSELSDAWRSRPAALTRYAPDVPPALNALILELLALDRAARPQSAAVVMERLCAIAGLPLGEHEGVSNAYLATPALVGRDQALTAIRKRMLSLFRGDGASLLIEGDAGSGRSRLLDACVLEAKLLGASVARADSGDAASGEWGVARALTAQLLELLPDEAVEAARLSRDVLGHVVDGLRLDGSVTGSVTPPERSLILRELRDFVLALAQSRRLVLAIDDADSIDEPSCALLGALAAKTDRHGLMLVLTIDRETRPEAASLHLYRSLAHRIEIEPLDAGQVEGLMRSVFGDAANLRLWAGRIHAFSRGNPRAAMELAQDLVSRGLARYEAGSWLLPIGLHEGDLPETLMVSLRRRVDGLGADARELADIVALAEADRLSMKQCASLTEHRDQGRLFRAIDELVAARVVTADAERFWFAQRGFPTALRAAMPEAKAVALHSRLADLLATTGGDVVQRAHHLIQAGRGLEAVPLLCSIDLRAQRAPLPLLERAIELADQSGMPASVSYQLRMSALVKAPLFVDADAFRRLLPRVLAQLERESGLALYAELSDLPPADRLAQALTRTQQRYMETPEHERGHSLPTAIGELARLSGALCAMAMSAFDLKLLESLPNLGPLIPLSPALAVVSQIVEASKEWIRGRGMRSQELYRQVLTRVAEADRAGLDEVQHERTTLGVQYSLALIEATLGTAQAEERALILERHREMRVNAWRVRMLVHFNRGDADTARKCMRRAELLQLQDGANVHYAGTSAAFELMACAHANDLLGVKSAVDALAGLARQHPGWQPMWLHGVSCYRELKGDLEGALEAVSRGLELAQPARHVAFGLLACVHIRLLGELGRIDEALACGLGHVENCERERLVPADKTVRLELAQIFARAGEHRRALDMFMPVIDWIESSGAVGLALGRFYEGGARIAISLRDRAMFKSFAERCAREYGKSKNPALSAKFARLLERAREHGMELGEEGQQVAGLLAPLPAESEHNTVRSRILECVDRSDRARCALTILLQSSDSCAGYLYGVEQHAVVLLAAVPELRAEEGLEPWVQARLRLELEDEAVTTTSHSTESDGMDRAIAMRYVHGDGRCFEALFLTAESANQQRIAAVLVLQIVRSARTLPCADLLRQIGGQLLEFGDVSGAVARIVPTQDG